MPKCVGSRYKIYSGSFFSRSPNQTDISLCEENPVLEVVVSHASTGNSINISAANVAADNFASNSSVSDVKELAFELGLWLSGLESFLNLRNHSFADENRAKTSTRDWTKEFRLTYSTLLLCSKLNFQLGKALREKNQFQNGQSTDSLENLTFLNKEFEFSSDDIYKLSLALKDSILLNESLLRAAPLKFGEWTAWSNSLSEKLKTIETFDKLIKTAERSGEEFLPEILRKLPETRPFAEQFDLQMILPRFGRILKWLSVVGRMLKSDEPLKPTLLIFSRVNEQIHEMIGYVNNRLLRFPNEEAELFGSLDGAAYAASIELKKVYSQELSGLVSIRPAPLIYAKIETAYALLNDSFEQTLIVFAQMMQPDINPEKIFPNFNDKLNNSLVLRQDLYRILASAQNAEQHPEKLQLESLHQQLKAFLNGSMQFLFYKDKETIERFVEEILVTKDKKDLVPILHRFGAYLETLFGQVNMRTVLAAHPFERN